MKQIRIFCDWYDGQGEQDAEVWFDQTNAPAPTIDWTTYKVERNQVIVSCK